MSADVVEPDSSPKLAHGVKRVHKQSTHKLMLLKRERGNPLPSPKHGNATWRS